MDSLTSLLGLLIRSIRAISGTIWEAKPRFLPQTLELW